MKRSPPLVLVVFLGLVCRLNAQLTLADVQTIIAQAVTRASALSNSPVSTNAVIALTDREGWVLGVWSINPGPPADRVANAIAKAGTAAFLSSDEHAFSSRTAGFIVQQNFPPGVQNKPPGPLVGVNFSQLAFSDINKFRAPGSVITYGSSPGLTLVAPALPISGGLAGTPGGLPLYKSGRLVGGVGVAGDGDGPLDITPQTITNADVDEDVALAGQTSFAPADKILGSKVTADGIRLAYLASTTSLGAVIPFGSLPGTNVAPYAPMASPAPFAYPSPANLGGITNGQMRQPILDDPSAVALPAGTARLIAAEVTNILAAAANRARTTRAGIRVPRGRQMQVFISVVNNPNADGSPPVVLGTFCTSPDTTRFSWDVAVQKARTAVFFSSTNRAYSARAVGFLAQSLYPPGIAGTQPGLFHSLQERFSIITPTPLVATNPVNGAVFTTSTSVNANLPNGMTIFPGGFPLYRNGVLIGAIGVSGDGIDQDDIVGATGAALFPPPDAIRSDRMQYRNARLPYAKFPRNPAL